MKADAVDAIGRLVAETPGLASILGAVLDRREADGRLPARLTVAADATCATALRTILATRAVRPLPDGRFRIELAAADLRLRASGGDGLDGLLYRVLGRAPRDPAAEEEALRRAVDQGLAHAPARSPCARAWIAYQRGQTAVGRGELCAIARDHGAEAAAVEAAAVTRAVDAALVNDTPLRLANFSAQILGRSKALLPGSDRLRRVCEALFDHDPATREHVLYDGDPTSRPEALLRALEVHGITRDEGALSVLCFGPLVYEKAGARFDQVARHAALGDVCRLTLQQLRGASLVELPDVPMARVTIIENRTTFLDYVDALVAHPELPRELVVGSDGQAGWATITLLRLLARARPAPAVRHASDLDRSGVLIWRSLARRSGLRITPFALDVATHRRFRERGLPVAPAELERLAALVDSEPADAPGHDLLVEIRRTRVWIEQEAIAHEAILPGSTHHDPIE